VVSDDATTVHFSLREKNDEATTTDTRNNEPVRDTRADMEPIQIVLSRRNSLNDDAHGGRNAGANIEAMDACVATMTTGEWARFDVPAELAYGDTGNFSFPAVGKNKRLILEVELLGVRGSEEEPATRQRDMTYEERIKEIRGHRTRGNEAFASGDNEGAIREYSMALTYLVEDFMMQLFDKYEEEANKEYASVHGNLAAAYLKMNAYANVVEHVGYVLKVDEKNAKAFYRRGKARMGLGLEDEAREDLLRAKKLTEDAGSKDVNVLRALRELEQAVRDRERASSKVFQGLFKTDDDENMSDDVSANPSPNTEARPQSDSGEGGFFSRVFGWRR